MNLIKYRGLFSILSVVLFFLYRPGAAAQTKLAAIFTDNMVLQQKSAVNIWGWDKAGQNIRVKSSWNNKTYTAKTGADGKWLIRISTPVAGKQAYELTITGLSKIVVKNILIGEVWLCTGQSNMEMPMKGFKSQPVIGSNDQILKSANPYIRLYTVPRSAQRSPQENSKTSFWKIAGPESVSNFSATGYFFGKLLYELLDVPVGLVNISYGGSSAEAWLSADALKTFPEITIPSSGDSIKSPNRTATLLYNGMLHPVTDFAIKGAIWYQGESNYDRPDQYEALFPAMVKEWRAEWKNDFPFYYAQIAPYNYAQLPPYLSGGKYNSAYLRDAQRKSASHIPNAAMAVLMDIGEENSIHPSNKETGGKRLALLALANTYGLKGFGAESPSYESMEINASTVKIKFSHALNGLTTFGKEPALFEIAGENKQFYPAGATINGATVTVSSPMVIKPVAVRYAFRDFVSGDLYNTEGLPASSFRTDNW